MAKAQNRFLRTSDFDDPEFGALKEKFDYLYSTVWRGEPHPFGAKDPDKVKIHWSREWEYPWAVLHGDVKKEHKILDCGCGGAPLLLYFIKESGCMGHGIDMHYGRKLNRELKSIPQGDDYLIDLRHFYIDPTLLVGKNIAMQKGDISKINFPDGFFDRVFCISVIEHLDEEIAKKCMKEMVRVLKAGGRLLITMDHTNYQGNLLPWVEGKYQTIIDWSGLKLDGESDFSVPSLDEIHGLCHVVGFVLKK